MTGGAGGPAPGPGGWAVATLARAGCVAPEEEAVELWQAASGDDSGFAALVARRTTGEPLAWITGTVTFCGAVLTVLPGVYVPRWQSEALAERSVRRLPPTGRAVDVGTGCGALARVLADRRPGAAVIGTESDPRAAACARGNGVTVAEGDLLCLPASWRGTVDVVVAVLPYVPTGALGYLPRDVQAFEPLTALDGGPDGLAVLQRLIDQAAGWLRPGGCLLMEVGGEQAEPVGARLEAACFGHVEVREDDEGDVRAVEAVAHPERPTGAGGDRP